MMDFINNLTQNLSTSFGNVLPNLLGALLLLILGFFVAGILRRLTESILKKTSIDERIGNQLSTTMRVDKFVAKLVYYLAIIFTLLIVLNILGVDGVLEPLQNMFGEFVGYLPNIVGAGIIAFAGYMLGTIGSEATAFLSERLEGFGVKAGLNTGTLSITKIVKQIVFILIFIPILIVALDTLNMKAISEPATNMLSSMLNAIPNILAAVILFGVVFVAGKYIVSILVELLKNVGVDNMSSSLGINAVVGERSLSELIGNVALFFITFMGILMAADKLELGQVEGILNEIFHISGKVFFGLLILLAGIFISNLAVKFLSNSETNSYLVPIARFAILGIFLAFALHTMGIAESIVNLAFGLTLGSIAVAFALAFGLGGRKAAGKQMESFFDSLNSKK